MLRSEQGLICIGADRISLKNVALLPTGPVMEVHNSQNTSLDAPATYPPGAAVLLRVSGAEKTRDVKLTNTATAPAKQALELGAGVKKNVVAVAQK